MRRSVLPLLIVLLTGCGGTFRIIAPEVPHPVAASTVLFGPDLQPLRVGEELEVVGHFRRSEQHWSILWTAVQLTQRDHDLSAFFVEQIRSHDGEAITGLSVTPATSLLFNMFGIVPFVPTVVRAEIEGDVVRRRAPKAEP